MAKVFQFKPFVIRLVEPEGSEIPKPRSGHRVVADSANLYSFGGYNPFVETEVDDDDERPSSKHLFKELWRFNFSTATWKKLDMTGDIPLELASHAAILLNGQLLVYGGTGVPFGESSSNELHVCDLNTMQWSLVETSGKPPDEQYGQAITHHKGNLYVIGGTTGYEYSMSVHRLCLATNHWSFLETQDQPKERYRHEVATDEERIYIFGGGTTNISFGFKNLPAFHITKQCWESLKTSPDPAAGFPMPRRCHSCVQLREKVYLCGGHDGERVFGDVWRLNLRTLRWKRLLISLPEAIYFHSAALSKNGEMLIFGGVTSIQHNTRTNKLYSVWLTIPPLVELCWLALQHYAPHMRRASFLSLLEAGIPRALLDRVDFAVAG